MMKKESQVWITEIQVWDGVNENTQMEYVVSRMEIERCADGVWH